MEHMFEVFADRDEVKNILLCKKHTLAGALAAAADAVEFWDRVSVFQNDNCVAIVALQSRFPLDS